MPPNVAGLQANAMRSSMNLLAVEQARVGAADRVVVAPREGRLPCTLLSVKVRQSPEWLKS